MKLFSFLVFLLLSVSVWSQSKHTYLMEGFAQGTTYHITYIDSSDKFSNLQDEIDSILTDFDFSVSTYNTNSLISKINSNQYYDTLDYYFTRCFTEGKKIWKATKGAFDPTVYPLVNSWGFGPKKQDNRTAEQIDSILQFVGFELIELKNGKICKKDPRVALDFNAFAQGFSVDVVSNYLKSKNIYSFIAEIGGELYAQGHKEDGTNWIIGIEEPIDNKETTNPLTILVQIDGVAVATSGNYRRYFIENGIKYAHHIDPKTGYPSKNNLLSASVFSKECISADATATGLLVMGLKRAKQFLKKHKEIEAFLIYSDDNGMYQTFETEGFKRLRWTEK
jgi:thiamine biosynthesis lipoprotein